MGFHASGGGPLADGNRPQAGLESGPAEPSLRPRDFPGLDPRWHRVEDAKLTISPWASLCAVRVTEGGVVRLAGTGWLAGPATVITAAHVVAGGTRGNGDRSFEVKFPGPGPAIPAHDAHVHERYRGDVTAPFDPFDVAALRIAPPGLDRLPIVDGAPTEASVEVAGYPQLEQGVLVTHQGRAFRPDDRLVLHNVDTKEGHSGAPVLLAGPARRDRVVIALHIHGFAANPFKHDFPDQNVALAIEHEIAAFIHAHVNGS